MGFIIVFVRYVVLYYVAFKTSLEKCITAAKQLGDRFHTDDGDSYIPTADNMIYLQRVHTVIHFL